MTRIGDLSPRQQAKVRRIAAAIAKDLFTNGIGERSSRLVGLDDAGRDLGGWSEEAVVRRIEVLLSKEELDW